MEFSVVVGLEADSILPGTGNFPGKARFSGSGTLSSAPGAMGRCDLRGGDPPLAGRRLGVSDPSVIRIMCPNLGCQRILAVPDHARGKLVRCRSCGTNIRIPATRNEPAPSSFGEAAGTDTESQTGQDAA